MSPPNIKTRRAPRTCSRSQADPASACPCALCDRLRQGAAIVERFLNDRRDRLSVAIVRAEDELTALLRPLGLRALLDATVGVDVLEQ